MSHLPDLADRPCRRNGGREPNQDGENRCLNHANNAMRGVAQGINLIHQAIPSFIKSIFPRTTQMCGRAAHTWPVMEFDSAPQAQVRTLRPSTWHVLRNDRGMVHCWDAALTLTARTSWTPGPSFSSVSQASQEDSSDPAGRAGFHGKPASIWLLAFGQLHTNPLSKRFVWIIPSVGRKD